MLKRRKSNLSRKTKRARKKAQRRRQARSDLDAERQPTGVRRNEFPSEPAHLAVDAERSNEPNEKKPVVTILVLIHPQGEKTQELSPKHCKTWISRINHQNPLTCYSKVCPDHFIAGKKRKHNAVVKFQNIITMEHSYATDVSNMSCNEAVEMQEGETASGETKVHAEQCGTGALKCPVHTCMSDTSHATYQTSKSLSQNTFSKEKQRLVVASECKQIFVQVSTDGSETTRLSTTKTLLPGASPINGKFMTINELMDVLLSSQSTQTDIPRGLKEDVYFVTDDTSNFDRRLAGKRSCFDDDCGVWRSSGTCMKKYYYRVEGNRMEYLELKNGLFHKPVNQKLIAVQPQPSQDSILILQRYYQVLKRKPEYKKRCTWIEKLPLTSSQYPQQPKLAVVEYVGKFPKDGSPHGNSNKSGNEYIWTKPKTIDEVKNKLAKGEPSRTVYPNFVWNDPNNVPRDMKQVRNNVTWGDQPMQHRKNTEDGVISLAKRSPLSVMLYSSELFVDIKNPCINKTMELTRDHSCRDLSRISPTLAWLGSQNLTAEALRAVIKWLGIEIFGALCARAEPAPMRVKLCSLATQKFTLTMYIELCLFMELCCARQGLKQPSVSQRGNYAEMEGSAGIRINVDGKYSITPKEDGRDLENGRGGEAQQELHLHHMLSHLLY